MENKVAQIQQFYEEYIHASRYARYLPEKGRRETWDETVERFHQFFSQRVEHTQPEPTSRALVLGELASACEAIKNKEIMPSMRALMTAGPALERDNVAGYNCAYLPIDDKRAFDEIMYILMCGTGVGFSVERKYVEQLPIVNPEFFPANLTIHIPDSKIGWATSFHKLISSLYEGFTPTMDYSRLREAGAPLKTFGGRSSGPEPLRQLCDYTINVFKNAKGRRLTSLEVHDIVCKIAEVIVVGGVRRSALLSLSNLTDERLRTAKSGQWYVANPQRSLANNSVCYTEKPDVGIFMQEWLSLYESKSGERGIFNRNAASSLAPSRREISFEFGTNPCSEIILRPKQFCNLTEVICREDDTIEDIERKIKLATFLGTLQSTLTDFRYLRKQWADNCNEERLLGVSLSGIQDCSVVRCATPELLERLRNVAISTNEYWADLLGIPRSAAITCVKPSGTVSQLTGVSSGIHPRYAQKYIRRVRSDLKDPLTQHLIDQNVPYEIDVINPSVAVFSFPIQSPKKSRFVDRLGAINQLELWRTFALHWCEHKPSVSIYVREHEWLDVAAWVYNNFDIMSGVSFFPYDDHTYRQAPYEKVDNKTFKALVNSFPDTLNMVFNENHDNTTSSKEMACTGGACEL